MTTFRPDTSFPLLKIAREHGADYGYVLRMSERIEVNMPPLMVAIYEAIRAEAQRRATTAHNAMHTGEAP